ncbi:hypothetical protein QMO56_18750 [Roseomonas sp. E05]|uniref:hypothetical protein n=1 Tax=Roseomonas sp. E05 TaxID=3046310 RepID=UPI0024BA398B|nr:hypothetical protein [Roseomonas sp. E05]MDJ0390153.1 hypothetical protein [Roseomonas sp. E05]
MTDAPDRMAGLARPMQHAVNNLFMVLNANLDSVASSLPPEDRSALRVKRALEGAKGLEALLRAYFRLGRPAERSPVDSGRFLEAVRPVLALAVGKPLKVEVLSTATISPPRPEVDLALLDLIVGARELPPGTPHLTLDGNVITVNWAPPEGAEAALTAAGLTVTAEAGTTRVTLA